jgi:hypothetical protein
MKTSARRGPENTSRDGSIANLQQYVPKYMNTKSLTGGDFLIPNQSILALSLLVFEALF